MSAMDAELVRVARRLRAYVSERDAYDDKPLYEALTDAARTSGSSGATVIRGVVGFGATSRKHADYDLRMSQDLPLIVEVVDAPHRIEALAEVWDAMMGAGLITVEDVEVVAYRGAGPEGP
jgi:PII-like signaling protein